MYIIFLCKVAKGQWANIAKVILLHSLFSCESMSVRPWANIAQVFFWCNIVLDVFKQY